MTASLDSQSAIPNPQSLLVIVGPTAVGKTALSLHLAEPLGGEIVSADSRLFYRGMDVGTAKPTPEERARAPHHLLDIAAPDETVGLAEFQEQAMPSSKISTPVANYRSWSAARAVHAGRRGGVARPPRPARPRPARPFGGPGGARRAHALHDPVGPAGPRRRAAHSSSQRAPRHPRARGLPNHGAAYL